jgi:ABC-type lipoprotein export system ATPase subunit
MICFRHREAVQRSPTPAEADEPTGNLDSKAGLEIMELLVPIVPLS